MWRLIWRMLAPYLAVAVGMLWLRNAWLAILLYHLQIVVLSRRDLVQLLRGWQGGLFLCLVLPFAVAGPVAYLLLSFMAGTGELQVWLARYGLNGLSFAVMVPYFGLLHPPLEQAHWSRVWGDARLGVMSHPCFAGYHVVVLAGLLGGGWLLLCFGVLLGASILWEWLARRTGGLLLPALGHILSDLGIILAAWWLTAG